jgi:hypothetical protein
MFHIVGMWHHFRDLKKNSPISAVGAVAYVIGDIGKILVYSVEFQFEFQNFGSQLHFKKRLVMKSASLSIRMDHADRTVIRTNVASQHLACSQFIIYYYVTISLIVEFHR